MPKTSQSNKPATKVELQKPSLCVEFLYSEDCPSHDRALEILRQVLQEEQVDVHVHMYKVETEAEAEECRFPGSPTIRIDGVDIDDNPGLQVGLSCRAYRQENGRISPLPPRDKVVQAVRNAKHNPRTVTSEQSELLPCS
jgi:hypothetical protein